MTPFDPGSSIRQRWRITFACPAGEMADGPSSDLAAAWSEALAADGPGGEPGLPFVTARDKPRVVLALPLPEAIAAERDLLDVFLMDRIALEPVRRAIASSTPPGCTLLDVHDVWVGEPALPGPVADADYRIELDFGPASAAEVLEGAAARLMAAATLPRTRAKGGGTSKAYDLRPLLADVAFADTGPPATLRVRTLVDPSRGAGRPDEVVAALADEAGVRLAIRRTTRERILLAGEPEPAPPEPTAR